MSLAFALLADAAGLPIFPAVVRYDAIRQVGNGPVTTQRFEAVVPVADAEPATIAPALNQAANQVARQVADWVG